tara:strand:+ start:191 stop:319 length:129 start_codon:yes stop_codon:yes gene_type:complete
MNLYIPDFVVYVIAIVTTLVVIIKLKKLENERIEALRNAEKN